MKRILITGASEGIGLETAKLLAKSGASITLVAHSEWELPGSGHLFLAAALTLAADVSW